MYWRIAVALLCVGSLVTLFNADFATTGDTWVAIALVATLLAGGLLIGRAWALLIGLTPLLLYAIDQDTGDVAAPLLITYLTVLFAGIVAVGLVANRAAAAIWRRSSASSSRPRPSRWPGIRDGRDPPPGT